MIPVGLFAVRPKRSERRWIVTRQPAGIKGFRAAEFRLGTSPAIDRRPRLPIEMARLFMAACE
jgi:hypothetical protein